MAVEVKVQVRIDKILVDAPQKEVHQEFRNTLATIPSGAVVAIGQSLADLIKEKPHNAEKFREELTFSPIYASNEKGLQNLLFFLEYLAVKLRKGGMFSRISSSNLLAFQLELPEYEKIEISTRQQFEFAVMKFIAGELTINNDAKGWEKWQRRVLEVSRPAFLLAWPFLWYFFVLFVASLTEGLGLLRWLFYLAGLFASYYLLMLFRVLALKLFLPVDLLKSELLSPKMGMGKFGAWVVERFLK